jgi:hypothetical protein
MDYRLSSNFTQRLPWKSSWSTHTNIPEIEEVLKKGFPEALVCKEHMLYIFRVNHCIALRNHLTFKYQQGTPAEEG